MKTELLWGIHNLIAHPVGEILYWIGLRKWGEWLHDATVPDHQPGSGRG